MLKRLLLLVRLPGDKLDAALDRLTTYRLVLYSLYCLVVYALSLSLLHKISISWYQFCITFVGLIIVCRISNLIFSYFFDVPHNNESDLITALILALILDPAVDIYSASALMSAGFAAMAAKYALTYGGRHIFNPAALGAFISGAVFHNYASWWIGNNRFIPVLVVISILVLRKIKRFEMTILFVAINIVFVIAHHGLHNPKLGHFIWFGLTYTALLFFTVIMLTEPLTSPTKRSQVYLYTGLVGILYSYSSLHLSPEQALLIGNLAAFALEPQKRLKLALVSKVREAEATYSYAFRPERNIKFLPGQYMEFTLPKAKSDGRGNRRYLTISSSPTENNLMFTLKIPPNPSAYKSSLLSMKPGDKMLAAQTAGHFTLPSNNNQPLIFIAGGVGITPFRSMIKYLIDTKNTQPMTLFYSANSPSEFTFTTLFKQAANNGLKTIYSLTGTRLPGWQGENRPIDADMIAKYAPDHGKSLIYISGPQAFVVSVRNSLAAGGISSSQVITDYFPGYN